VLLILAAAAAAAAAAAINQLDNQSNNQSLQLANYYHTTAAAAAVSPSPTPQSQLSQSVNPVINQSTYCYTVPYVTNISEAHSIRDWTESTASNTKHSVYKICQSNSDNFAASCSQDW